MSEIHHPFLAFGGIDQRKSALLIDKTSSPDLNNVDLHPVGCIRKRSGYEVIANPWEDDSLDEQCTGIATLARVSTGAKYMLAFGSETIYRTTIQSGALSWASVDTRASSSNGPIVARGRYVASYVGTEDPAPDTVDGDVLYYADGENTPRIETGTSNAVMPTGIYAASGTRGIPAGATSHPNGSPASYLVWRDWTTHPPRGFCLRGEGKQDRMFAWGFDNDPNRIDFSELGVPWNFLQANVDVADPNASFAAHDGGWFYAMANDSDYIVAVWTLFDNLIVFKRYKTLIYGGTAGYDLALKAEYPVGCVSYASIISVGTDLMWWSDSGPVSLSGVQKYGDVEYSNLGREVIDEIQGMTQQYEGLTCGFHDKHEYRVGWFIPQTGSTTPERVVVMYYDEPRRWTVWSGDMAEMICLNRGLDYQVSEDSQYGGRFNGDICVLNTGTLDDETGIDAHYVTKWLDYESPGIRKRLIYMDVIIGALGAEDLEIDVGWEFTDTWQSVGRMTRALGAPSAYWGYGIFGTSLWGGTAEVIKRWDMEGSGYYMRVKFYSEGVSPFQLFGWRPILSAKGER